MHAADHPQGHRTAKHALRSCERTQHRAPVASFTSHSGGKGRTVAERVEVREDSEDFWEPVCLRLGNGQCLESAAPIPCMGHAEQRATLARQLQLAILR